VTRHVNRDEVPFTMSVLDLVGVSIDDSSLLEFLNSLDPSYDTTREEHKYPDCTYWNFKPLGLSLCFKPNEKPILDAIYVFNNGVNKYKKYKGPLPLDLSLDQNNVDVVKKFGEPDKKGGVNVPVWISYESKSHVNKHEKSVGIQFDFTSKSFDDRNNPISGVTFFQAS
jgi:hypothetical protein